MFPPSPAAQLNLEALSGICGSISIACWVVVFSPQIIENFRRGSADGLSLLFLIVWLAGDVFNILGAVLQGVLPTMIILAVYYTLADIVLLGQCFYYRGFTLSDEIQKPQDSSLGNTQTREQESLPPQRQTERTPLLPPASPPPRHDAHHPFDRRRSSLASLSSTIRDHFGHIDSTHLSPAVPLLEPPKPSARPVSTPTTTTTQKLLWNTFAIALVCAAGVLGWYISVRSTARNKRQRQRRPDALTFDLLGQIFGYLCAVFYLGSRIPQLLLNWRRKSTEGVSLLFFLFACIGNLTYVLSIFAYSPVCGGKGGRCGPGERERMYGRYLLVNASWLLGSLGTLGLDLAIFAQFVMYRDKDVEDESSEGADL
ncbi:Putative vacuolar membrane transporter for cationic amino acids [Emydomyces testavorans]|uniref:Vacuolar membrane transporter for cationic amino acids n=1 Tax=Emydomyces testavorans TaxID=2070801 RepID=A0AAF0IFJ5_9EURO|nr:Putative vacuolar membrane transporter for cationic amino acids [Emydomyces testavorans]